MLAAFVVFEGEVAEDVFGVVGGGLHGDGAGGVLRGGAVEKDAVEFEFQHFGKKHGNHRLGVGLDDVVVDFSTLLEMTGRSSMGGEGEEGFADGGLGGGGGEVVVDELDARVAAVEEAVDKILRQKGCAVIGRALGEL